MASFPGSGVEPSVDPAFTPIMEAITTVGDNDEALRQVLQHFTAWEFEAKVSLSSHAMRETETAFIAFCF